MLYQAMKSAVRLLNNKKQTDLVSVVVSCLGFLTHFCKLIAPYQLDYSSQIVIPYYLYHFNKYCSVILIIVPSVMISGLITDHP